MRKIRVSVAALMLGAGALLMSSCIGKFGLFNKLLSWNEKATNEKWINWLIFLGLNIIPVYEFSLFLDYILFNSIEFWTGSSPVAGIDMNVKGEKGEYHVKSTENGYHIELLGSGAAADLVFDAAKQTWSMEADGQSVQLVQFVDGNANIYGSNMNVDMAKTMNLMAAR